MARILRKNSQTVVYTSITGNYDKPRTDILVLSNDLFRDPRRSARMHKCLPPKADYSLWVDGNTSPKVSIDYLIENYLQNCDICVLKHPIRDCIYEEAKTCQTLNLDDWDTIENQTERYQKEGYPQHAGLSATTYVLRRHNRQIEEFNNLWWAEVCRGSKRDQLSFDYAAWKIGIKVGYFFEEVWEDNFKNNDLFNYWKHAK